MAIVESADGAPNLPIDGMLKPCTSGPIIPKSSSRPSIQAQFVTHSLWERKNCGFFLIVAHALDRSANAACAAAAIVYARYNERFTCWLLSMKVTLIPVTPFQQNCSIVVCEATGRAAIVDPGGDIDRIVKAVAELDVTIDKVLLTHGHLDHCGGAKAIADHYGVVIHGPHKEDAFWIDQLPEQSKRFGFGEAQVFTPERWLEEGDTVQFGEEIMEVYHCPGHTPGHVVFFSRENRLALVGDVLFAGSIGRTDFPRGNHADLVRSVQEKLWPLGDDVTFVPGHGPTSTLGHERRTNPYVGDRKTA
ncbi:MBL fold metallo-hydrolase [Caballeronia sordidicola]|nr:MBL fold metallo-hydrolase [Caballeronia sordidicola]